MRIFLILSLSVTLLLCAGCGGDGGRPADLPPLFPVNISIIQDGQPLEGATVTLIATTAGPYSRSSATTNEAGIARIRTHGFVGVPAGEFAVAIEKQVIEGEREVFDGDEVVGRVGGRAYNLVDTTFSTQATTTFSISVPAERRGATETFDVGAAVRVFLLQHGSD